MSWSLLVARTDLLSILIRSLSAAMGLLKIQVAVNVFGGGQ